MIEARALARGENTQPRKILCHKRFYNIVYAIQNTLVFDGLYINKLFMSFFISEIYVCIYIYT